MKYFTLLFIPLFFACESNTSLVLNDGKPIRINYRFNDSSVAPEYQRNYSITVFSIDAVLLVDSYGDLLLEKRFPIETSEYLSLIETINNAQLISGRHEPEVPCEGGTSESLTVLEDEIEVYHAYFDHCASNPSTSMGDVEAVFDSIHTFIPNLQDMLE